MPTIAQILNQNKLNTTEKEILLAFILKKDRSYLNTFPEKQLTKAQVEVFADFVLRLEQNEPLAYLLGFKEFYGLKFFVNNSVLIPREETEELVNQALNFLGNKDNSTIIDVGTGSGCIAISLAKNLPKANIIASDISAEALRVAKKNALLCNTNNISFIQTDLLENVTQEFDLITANLPYIPTQVWQELPKNIHDFEPRVALDSGRNSMSLYKKLFSLARDLLKADGRLIYEINGDIIKLSAADLVEKVRE